MRTPLREHRVRCERPRPLALLVLVSLAALSTAHAAPLPAWTLEPGPRSSRIIPSSARDGGCIAWAPVPTVVAGVGRGAWMCRLRQPGWAPGRIGMKLRSAHLQVCGSFRLRHYPALGTGASPLDGQSPWTGSPSQLETLERPAENPSSCWTRKGQGVVRGVALLRPHLQGQLARNALIA